MDEVMIEASYVRGRRIWPRRTSRVFIVTLLMITALEGSAAEPAAAPPSDRAGHAFFEKNIRPLLVERCYECHSKQAKKIRGGLSLDFKDGLLKGGDLGPSIEPGK